MCTRSPAWPRARSMKPCRSVTILTEACSPALPGVTSIVPSRPRTPTGRPAACADAPPFADPAGDRPAVRLDDEGLLQAARGVGAERHLEGEQQRAVGQLVVGRVQQQRPSPA